MAEGSFPVPPGPQLLKHSPYPSATGQALCHVGCVGGGRDQLAIVLDVFHRFSPYACLTILRRPRCVHTQPSTVSVRPNSNSGKDRCFHRCHWWRVRRSHFLHWTMRVSLVVTVDILAQIAPRPNAEARPRMDSVCSVAWAAGMTRAGWGGQILG